MKINFRSLPLLLIVAGIVLSTGSCTKFRENRQYFTLEDHNAAEDAYNDMFRLACQEGDYYSSLINDSCYTVVFSDTAYPRTATFTFAPGCRDVYQQQRSGSLTIVYSQNFGTPGATATVVPGADYYYGGYQINGSMTITNKGLNSAGHTNYDLVVATANVTTANNGGFTWACDHNMELYDAQQQTIFDDVYHITGTASGTDHESHQFTVAIDDALVKDQSCKWPRSGNITMTISDLDDKEVDYSSNDCTDNQVGCCDNQVSVKTGGKRQENLKLE